jgi:hypothetical protein
MEAKEPTILIDVSPGAGAEFDRSFLEREGHEVLMCHGPARGATCPLLAGTGCELVDRAHGIIFVLDLDRPQHRWILERYRQVTLPSVPIRAVVRPGQRQQYADLLADFEVWEHEPNAADLDGFSAEVEAAERLR